MQALKYIVKLLTNRNDAGDVSAEDVAAFLREYTLAIMAHLVREMCPCFCSVDRSVICGKGRVTSCATL